MLVAAAQETGLLAQFEAALAGCSSEQAVRLARLCTASRQMLVLTLLGSGFGIALTFLTQAILHETNPGMMILLSGKWIFGAILLAVVGAALGAAYPAYRAASYDPVVALAYE